MTLRLLVYLERLCWVSRAPVSVAVTAATISKQPNGCVASGPHCVRSILGKTP